MSWGECEWTSRGLFAHPARTLFCLYEGDVLQESAADSASLLLKPRRGCNQEYNTSRNVKCNAVCEMQIHQAELTHTLPEGAEEMDPLKRAHSAARRAERFAPGSSYACVVPMHLSTSLVTRLSDRNKHSPRQSRLRRRCKP